MTQRDTGMKVTKKSRFYECECCTHGLLITSFSDSNQIYLSMMEQPSAKTSFLKKLKFAFKYLRTGKMHEDQLIISREKAMEVAEDIIKRTSIKRKK